MIEESQRIITTIKQMEVSLDDTKPNDLYASQNEEMATTYPLSECLKTLKEKHRTISKLHHERCEQVKSNGPSCQLTKLYTDAIQSSFKHSSPTHLT